MKKHPAVKELYDIIKKQDWTTFCPEKTRELMLEMWLEKWLVNLEISQSVVNTKYLTSEYNDAIKVYMAQQMAEELAETCTIFKTKDKEITACVIGLRRKEKNG